MTTSENVAIPRACIVYLARSTPRDLSDLRRSLRLLKKHYLSRFPRKVIIFHEDFSQELKDELSAQVCYDLIFSKLVFRLPNFVDASEVPSKILGRFPIGYRHMCRFFAGRIFDEATLSGQDYYWRMDTDSFIHATVRSDPFVTMVQQNLDYGYIAVLKENPDVVINLWAVTKQYMRARAISPKSMSWLLTRNGEWNLKYFYNNFEVVRLKFGKSAEYSDYFDYLDHAGGIYKHRWGDAPIRTLASGLFLEDNKRHRFRNIAYSHSSFYTHLRHKLLDKLRILIAR